MQQRIQGGAMRRCPPPPSESPNNFLTRYTVKNGISNLYILLKSTLKMQEMPFQRPKFQKIFGGACPRTPLQLCRHYGLPLTKILATPLSTCILIQKYCNKPHKGNNSSSSYTEFCLNGGKHIHCNFKSFTKGGGGGGSKFWKHDMRGTIKFVCI